MKKILLFFIFSFLLTSCISIKQIDYTNNSTVLDKSNQELYPKLLNDINLKYVYLKDINDFDTYLKHLDTLSEISCTYIKDSEKLTEEIIDIEIDLQKKIIKTLKDLSIPEDIFASKEAYQAGNDYITEYLIKLVEARLDYLQLTSNNLSNTSITRNDNCSLIDLATIPNLNAIGQNLRTKYLK